MAAKRKTPKRDKRTGRFLSNPLKRGVAAKRKRKAPARKRKTTGRKRDKRTGHFLPNPSRKRKAPAKKPRPNPFWAQAAGRVSNKKRDDLEIFVDSETLAKTLGVMSQFCMEKAEHFERTLGQPAAAKKWRRASSRLGQAAWAAHEDGI